MEEWSPYEAHDLKTIVRICLLRFDLVVSDKTFVHVKHGSARQNFRARDNQKGNLSFFFFRFENLNVDFGF